MSWWSSLWRPRVRSPSTASPQNENHDEELQDIQATPDEQDEQDKQDEQDEQCGPDSQQDAVDDEPHISSRITHRKCQY